MIADNKLRMQKNLVVSIANVTKRLKEIYLQVSEDEFRNLFFILGAHEGIAKCAIGLVEHFDLESKKYNLQYPRMMTILANDPDRQQEFIEAIENFRPGERGAKGGLKRFSKEFKKERDILVRDIKEYMRLKRIWDNFDQVRDDMKQENLTLKNYQAKKEKFKREKEEEKFRNFEKVMPKSIRDNTGEIGPNTLALNWMVKEYPLEESTLRQIIYHKSNRQITKKHGKR